MLHPSASDLSLPLLEHLPLGLLLYRLAEPARDDSLTLVGFSAVSTKLVRPDLASHLGRRIFEIFPAAQPERIAKIAQVARRGGTHHLGETLYGDQSVARTVFSVLAVVFGVYVGLAARARRLFTSPRALRLVNRATGAVMASAAAAIAAK